MIIGLYGKSGSGKTTACHFFSEKGFYIINADKIGHDILSKGNNALSRVIELFGEEFLDSDGSLDRKKLGKHVFSDKKKLEKLNNITKPLIENEILSLIKTHKNAVIDGAVLHNTKIIEYCDLKILIKSDKSLERIISRDNLSEEEAKKRLNSQIICENADIIIENNQDINKLYEKLKNVLDKL